MDYKLMTTPFKLIPFHDMSKNQANQYYLWFLSVKEERIRWLEEYISLDDKDINLDYSPESLVKVWNWFESKIQWENKTEEEIKLEVDRRPEKYRNSTPYCTQKMTTLTLAIAMDISIYFGEMLIVNNPTIYWGYRTRPKQLDGVNRPVLLGFRYAGCVFPYTLIQVLIRKSTEEKNSNRLLELYSKWSKNV